MNVLFIFRAPEFSPNMEDKDALILKSVAERVENLGCTVRFMKEENLTESDFSEIDLKGTRYSETDLKNTNLTGVDLKNTNLTEALANVQAVFSMGRRMETLKILKQMEGQGVRVFNSPASIDLCCNRMKLVQQLDKGNIPMPQTIAANLDEALQMLELPFWMKRGDGYSQNPHDVAFINDAADAVDQAIWMKQQGYRTVVSSRHIEGDLLKFYGVCGTDSPFFYWYYAADGHSKFGLEKNNGAKHGYEFNQEHLADICTKAAGIANLNVYGGDCIVDKNGEIYLIDLNDWPSFSKCREQAAEAISKLIENV